MADIKPVEGFRSAEPTMEEVKLKHAELRDRLGTTVNDKLRKDIADLQILITDLDKPDDDKTEKANLTPDQLKTIEDLRIAINALPPMPKAGVSGYMKQFGDWVKEFQKQLEPMGTETLLMISEALRSMGMQFLAPMIEKMADKDAALIDAITAAATERGIDVKTLDLSPVTLAELRKQVNLRRDILKLNPVYPPAARLMLEHARAAMTIKGPGTLLEKGKAVLVDLEKEAAKAATPTTPPATPPVKP